MSTTDLELEIELLRGIEAAQTLWQRIEGDDAEDAMRRAIARGNLAYYAQIAERKRAWIACLQAASEKAEG